MQCQVPGERPGEEVAAVRARTDARVQVDRLGVGRRDRERENDSESQPPVFMHPP